LILLASVVVVVVTEPLGLRVSTTTTRSVPGRRGSKLELSTVLAAGYDTEASLPSLSAFFFEPQDETIIASEKAKNNDFMFIGFGVKGC
jgi:hypothetical protein